MNNFNNITQEQFEQIEWYLYGSMEAAEKLEFNTRLQEDPTFATLVEEVKQTLLGVESSVLKEHLNTYHKEMEDVVSVPSSNKNNRVWLIGIAAAIAVVFGVTWMMSLSTSSEKLYAKYYTPDPGLPTTMSSTNNFAFYDAMVNYKREEYTEAIQKWEAILPEKPTNDTLNYFLGVANLANGNEASAIDYLTKAADDKNSFLKNDIFYYLGLAYLKENNIALAKENFKLSNSSQSEKILSELNN